MCLAQHRAHLEELDALQSIISEKDTQISSK
jgi:hypothetical protein